MKQIIFSMALVMFEMLLLLFVKDREKILDFISER
jgi:hypothetical protein